MPARAVGIHLICARAAKNALVLVLRHVGLSMCPLGVAATIVQEVRLLLLLGVRVESIQGLVVLGCSLRTYLMVWLMGLVAGLL